MWKYYIQLPLLPIYYLVSLGKSIYSDIKWAYIDTRAIYYEHRRHYGVK